MPRYTSDHQNNAMVPMTTRPSTGQHVDPRITYLSPGQHADPLDNTLIPRATRWSPEQHAYPLDNTLIPWTTRWSPEQYDDLHDNVLIPRITWSLWQHGDPQNNTLIPMKTLISRTTCWSPEELADPQNNKLTQKSRRRVTQLAATAPSVNTNRELWRWVHTPDHVSEQSLTYLDKHRSISGERGAICDHRGLATGELGCL